MPIMNNPPAPFGTIITWTGLLVDIPGGWLLCDGTNGTPDLRVRFVRSVPNSSTEPGGTGGVDTHVVTEAQMPIHTHTITDPLHRHEFSTSGSQRISTDSAETSIARSILSPSIANTGSDTAHENRPSYFEVAYIQKVSDNG